MAGKCNCQCHDANLPIYMAIISTILHGVFHSPVSPMLKPTVLKAETASNMTSSKSKLIGSKTNTRKAVINVITTARVKTFDALTRQSGSTCL